MSRRGISLSRLVALPLIVLQILSACSSKDKSTEPEPLTLDDLPGTVAYASDRLGDWNIYMSRFSGDRPINLTSSSEADDTHPLWIDSGQKLLFASDRSGTFELYRINDISNRETSLEQITNFKAAEIKSLDLSPLGEHVYLLCRIPPSQAQIVKLDLTSGECSIILDAAPGSDMRLIGSSKMLLGTIHSSLNEYDIVTSSLEEYVYNDAIKDLWAVITAFDVSSKTGIIYAAMDQWNFNLCYRLISWNLVEHSGYRWLSAETYTGSDCWRCFRVIDLGSAGDYILQSFRSYDQYPLSDWKIGVWAGDGAEPITGAKTLEDMSGDNLYPDWTIVEHISP